LTFGAEDDRARGAGKAGLLTDSRDMSSFSPYRTPLVRRVAAQSAIDARKGKREFKDV